jgi:predicted permease
MWFRRRPDSDFRAEIEAHIRLEEDRLIAEGITPKAARAAARKGFGNATAVQERFHDSTRRVWWEQFGSDLRYGLRSLRKAPAFTLAGVLTIALGVGANTAIFSLVDAVLLRTLAVRNPGDLVFLGVSGSEGPAGAPPYPCFELLRRNAQSFTGLAAYAADQLRVEIDGRPEQVMGQVASGNYFDLLGVKPALGRLLNSADDRLDAPAAVIGHRYWQRRFGGEASVIGKTIVFDNQSFTIVGVMPPQFAGMEPGHPLDVTFPITTQRSLLGDAGAWWFQIVGRLRPGVSVFRARAESNAIFQGFMDRSGRGSSDMRKKFFDHVVLPPAGRGEDFLRERFSKPLYVLMGIVILVLAIATMNIANLLLARGMSRRREYAIRLATGASRARLVRQTLTETLLLFGLAAIPALLLADATVQILQDAFSQGRLPIALGAHIGGRVLLFTAISTLLAGMFAGLVPALRAFHTDLQQAMKESRGGESHSSGRWGRALVGAQVAVSLVLLAEAAAFVETLIHLRRVDLGFHSAQALTMSIEPPAGAVSARQYAAYWSRVLDNVRSIPGMRSAALSIYTPLSGRDRGSLVQVAGYAAESSEDRTVHTNAVSEDYFETLGIQLLRGRTFTARDAEGAPQVAMINEAAARKYFAGRDPLGQTFRFDKAPASEAGYRIVGVVADAKHMGLREHAARFAFFALRQPGERAGRFTLSVVSAQPAGQTLTSIRRTIAEIDPRILISEVITMQQQVDSTLLSERLLSALSAALGGLAMVLASIGLYGVLSYRIGQQRQAIGIRMALGATPGGIAAAVLRQSAAVIGVGVMAGLPFALLAGRATQSLFWGVEWRAAGIYGAAILLLCLVACASSYLPARRAAGIDPADTLRYD